MWFYADNKVTPVSPKVGSPKMTSKMTPIKVRPGSPRVTPRPGSPRVTPRVTPRPGSPRLTPRITPRPGSPRVTPRVTPRPGSPILLPRPVTGSPIIRPLPGSPVIRPLPGLIRPPPRTPPRKTPGSPVIVHPGHKGSPKHFEGCDTSYKTVPVPCVKYVLDQHPVVFEKIRKEVKYNQVPVTYEFEKKQHPVKVVKKPCSPCGTKPVSPCGKKQFKLPCGMQDNWHLNRSPCRITSPLGKGKWSPALKDTANLGGKHKWWMGKNASSPCGRKSPCGRFPRWQSQYVPQGRSPCMVGTATAGKPRCGTC